MNDVTHAYLRGRMDELQSILEFLEKEKDIPIYALVGAIKLRIALCEDIENITEAEIKV